MFASSLLPKRQGLVSQMPAREMPNDFVAASGAQVFDLGYFLKGALAGGIWEALITTIMGMSVAIPTLVFYYLLRLRTRSLMIETIEAARDLMKESPEEVCQNN